MINFYKYLKLSLLLPENQEYHRRHRYHKNIRKSHENTMKSHEIIVKSHEATVKSHEITIKPHEITIKFHEVTIKSCNIIINPMRSTKHLLFFPGPGLGPALCHGALRAELGRGWGVGRRAAKQWVPWQSLNHHMIMSFQWHVTIYVFASIGIYAYIGWWFETLFNFPYFPMYFTGILYVIWSCLIIVLVCISIIATIFLTNGSI